jgi:hypothetical protein
MRAHGAYGRHTKTVLILDANFWNDLWPERAKVR